MIIFKVLVVFCVAATTTVICSESREERSVSGQQDWMPGFPDYWDDGDYKENDYDWESEEAQQYQPYQDWHQHSSDCYWERKRVTTTTKQPRTPYFNYYHKSSSTRTPVTEKPTTRTPYFRYYHKFSSTKTPKTTTPSFKYHPISSTKAPEKTPETPTRTPFPHHNQSPTKAPVRPVIPRQPAPIYEDPEPPIYNARKVEFLTPRYAPTDMPAAMQPMLRKVVKKDQPAPPPTRDQLLMYRKPTLLGVSDSEVFEKQATVEHKETRRYTKEGILIQMLEDQVASEVERVVEESIQAEDLPDEENATVFERNEISLDEVSVPTTTVKSTVPDVLNIDIR